MVIISGVDEVGNADKQPGYIGEEERAVDEMTEGVQRGSGVPVGVSQDGAKEETHDCESDEDDEPDSEGGERRPGAADDED